MPVVIRMKRTGRRHRPCYRISVADSRKARDGRVIETIGLYDPIAPKVENRLTLQSERALHWLQHGAKPSETVITALKQVGLWEQLPTKKKRSRAGRKKKTATRARKVEAKKVRAERKEVRRAERKSQKPAAEASS